jgi:hypothetical protein
MLGLRFQKEKEELEEKKPRSWLKSVSAFANGVGGSLFFRVANDRTPKGLKNPQYMSDKVSELINQRIDPKPFFLLIPFKEGEMSLLQIKVLPGQSTPYYYKADGVCVAYIRSGNESVEAPTHILNELILKGSGKAFRTVWGVRYIGLRNMFTDTDGNIFSFYGFPKEIRRGLYTSNAIEGFNAKRKRETRKRILMNSEENATVVITSICESYNSLKLGREMNGLRELDNATKAGLGFRV